jgi:hypothetical protein
VNDLKLGRRRRGPWQSRVHRAIGLLLALAAAGAAIGVASALAIRASGYGGLNRGVEAFLREVRDGRYAQAYERICQYGAEDRASFVARFAAAANRGHGVASFQIRSTFGDGSLSLTATVGTVAFKDGTTTSVYFDQEPSNPPTCLPPVGYEDLLS